MSIIGGDPIKIKWSKPEITIMVRKMSHELVLANCRASIQIAGEGQCWMTGGCKN
jgi:hypothetical protein